MAAEKITGRILKSFDGTVTDDKTGEIKAYQPSITLIDDDTFEQVKCKISPEEYVEFGHMVGKTITFRGKMEKPAKPAEYQGIIQVPKK